MNYDFLTSSVSGVVAVPRYDPGLQNGRKGPDGVYKKIVEEEGNARPVYGGSSDFSDGPEGYGQRFGRPKYRGFEETEPDYSSARGEGDIFDRGGIPTIQLGVASGVYSSGTGVSSVGTGLGSLVGSGRGVFARVGYGGSESSGSGLDVAA